MDMKKYFKFTRLKETLKPFSILMIMIVVGQCYTHTPIGIIVIGDFILMVLYVFETLVIDWVRMKNNDSKDKNPKE